jgi:L-asparaginase II
VTTAPELTEELIAAAMAKADARVCVPGDRRCYAFPYDLAGAQATCTTKGRCKVGWVVRKSGRESWDVWLEVRTGLVKLIAQADA